MAFRQTHELCDQVSADGMMNILSNLQKWEKFSGSADELASLRYVQSVIAPLGYRTEILMHDAYISLPISGRVEVGGKVLDAITHSYSVSSGPQGLKGALVDVGTGSEAEFAAGNVEGCIVIITGLATPAHADRARRYRATGQVHVAQGDNRHEMCISPVWGSPSAETLDNLPNSVVVTIGREEGVALREQLSAGAVHEATLFADVDTGWRKTPILIADMDAPGAPKDAPYVLFSGHHDTWYYGVMDNGSANATMLEVARLAANVRDRWQRGLRFAFWSGHSHGRYSGSAWYADEFWEEMEQRCVAHVNVDSTGGRGANIVTGSGCASELRGLAIEAIRDQAGQEYKGKRFGRQGDESFWGIGVPSIFNSISHHNIDVGSAPGAAKLGWWWHTEHDTIDKIDPDNLVRDTRIFMHVVGNLVLSPVLPLEYSVHASDLVTHLQGLQKSLKGRLDLSALIERTRAFGERAARLEKLGQTLDVAEERARVNTALMRISRELVPMDYTRGDRFVHDPALAQSPWPILIPVEKLAAVPQDDEDDIGFHTVSARRAANRLSYALRNALHIVGEALGEAR